MQVFPRAFAVQGALDDVAPGQTPSFPNLGLIQLK